MLLLRLPPASSSSVEPELVDTFHTYVRPVFQPVLTDFCKTLTGITQAQVDSAPSFPEAVSLLYRFLHKHDLLDPAPAAPRSINESRSAEPFLDPFSAEHRSSLKRNVLFCSHGPFDIRDFIPKACWINGFAYGPPVWLRKCSILDVRKATLGLVYLGKVDERGGEGVKLASPARMDLEGSSREDGEADTAQVEEAPSSSSSSTVAQKTQKRFDSTIPGLLLLLDLEPFQGQLHSGLDDTRNLARVVAEVVRRVIVGARSWSDESRWDEPLGEDQEQEQGKFSLAQQAQKVIDGLAEVSLDGHAHGDTGSNGHSAPPKPATRRSRPPPVPLAPHIRDQLLASNVYLPEYPPPPPAPNTLPTPISRAQGSPAPLTASRLLPSARSNGPARLTDSSAGSTGGEAEEPFSGDEATVRRLLKGGSVYYPKRWAWMGKREGVVRWDLEVAVEEERRREKWAAGSERMRAEGQAGSSGPRGAGAGGRSTRGHARVGRA